MAEIEKEPVDIDAEEEEDENEEDEEEENAEPSKLGDVSSNKLEGSQQLWKANCRHHQLSYCELLICYSFFPELTCDFSVIRK